ncbi:hypothetical protein C5S53_06760, partial [Methanophagales archaeon]
TFWYEDRDGKRHFVTMKVWGQWVAWKGLSAGTIAGDGFLNVYVTGRRWGLDEDYATVKPL